MRKIHILALLYLFVFSGCLQRIIYQVPDYSSHFAPQEVIDKVEEHTVSIAVYYFMGYEEYQNRIANIKKSSRFKMLLKPDFSAFWLDFIEKLTGHKFNIEFIAESSLIYPRLIKPQIVIPLETKKGDKPVYAIAYIGAGTVTRFDTLISVRHLFVHDENTYDRKIWIFKEDLDHAVEASLLAISMGETFADDYAVIRTEEPLGLPGLKIAKESSRKGDRVIFSGSVGGMVFFTRFGILTDFRWFFKSDSEYRLHLSFWENFKYLCIFPSGPGDSGGSIKNLKGEITGIIYCGIEVYQEQYAFSNPLSMLRDFLKTHRLEWIGK